VPLGVGFMIFQTPKIILEVSQKILVTTEVISKTPLAAKGVYFFISKSPGIFF
jgi:hypothetical protein